MPPFTIPTLKRNPFTTHFSCGFVKDFVNSDNAYAQYLVAQLPTIHRLDFFCVDYLY